MSSRSIPFYHSFLGPRILDRSSPRRGKVLRKMLEKQNVYSHLYVLSATCRERKLSLHNADRLTEYNHLKAAKAWKGLGDAEMTVGRVHSIISENGFSCSELSAALRRSKAVDGHQPILQSLRSNGRILASASRPPPTLT
jgi:hypothetical protein